MKKRTKRNEKSRMIFDLNIARKNAFESKRTSEHYRVNILGATLFRYYIRRHVWRNWQFSAFYRPFIHLAACHKPNENLFGAIFCISFPLNHPSYIFVSTIEEKILGKINIHLLRRRRENLPCKWAPCPIGWEFPPMDECMCQLHNAPIEAPLLLVFYFSKNVLFEMMLKLKLTN